MIKAKKLQLSFVTLFLMAGATSAQAIAPDKSVRACGGWYVEAEPFWARQTDTLISTLPFAANTILSMGQVASGIGTVNFYYYRPDHDFGFRLAAGYDFCGTNCCNFGFSLEYTHLDTNNDKSIQSPFLVGGAGALVPALVPYASASFLSFAGANNADTSLDFKYDTVDLLGHKNWTICNCVDVQAFAGARYVRFRENFHTHFYNNPTDAAILLDEVGLSEDFKQNFDTRSDGVGPRVGFNVFYPVAKGFGLATEVAGNLLYNETRSDYSELLLLTSPLVLENNFSQIRLDQSRLNRIVPGLSGKVSVVYRTFFCNRSSLTVEAGYRGDKYFDLSNLGPFVQAVNGTAGGALGSAPFVTSGVYHDVDISGPFLSISYHL
jgi:hypothetical protein